MFEVSFDGVASEEGQCFIALQRVRQGKGIIPCFNGCKPGGWDWVTCRGMVELDKSTDAGEVIPFVGL